jgi:hypothetical protein
MVANINNHRQIKPTKYNHANENANTKTQTVMPSARYKRLVKKMELNICFSLLIVVIT